MFKTITRSAALAVLVSAVSAASAIAQSDRTPDVVCPEINVPTGNTLKKMFYAIGVQIYRWNGTSWAFVAPEANLYADPNYRGKVGTHYGGPTWESNSGSKVIGARIDGCSPDATAVAWLLLSAAESEGPGVFDGLSYVQRLNTVGGIAPASPGLYVGQEVRVPYTTEYYFYRSEAKVE